ncbi:hypothetical protein E4U55_001465 [Claviceps digitariae]|nr:hypothetical protein E4U55_001465 [Claviceps digitariae]
MSPDIDTFILHATRLGGSTLERAKSRPDPAVDLRKNSGTSRTGELSVLLIQLQQKRLGVAG